MKIKQQSVVALTWVLKDSLGEELDVLDEPVEFLIGGDDLLLSIEAALMGKEAGDEINLHLEPADAFGDYDETLVLLEPRSAFPAELEEGMIYETLPVGCSTPEDHAAFYAVTDIYPEHVVLDGNHPLAGIALNIEIQVTKVREASLEEIGKGTTGTGFFKLEVAHTDPSGTLH